MPYQFALQDNPFRWPLRNRIESGAWNADSISSYPHLSPTIKQLHGAHALIVTIRRRLTDGNLQDIIRQGEIKIDGHYYDSSEDESLGQIKADLTNANTAIKQVVLNFIKLDLLNQVILLFAVKETFCERLHIQKSDWMPMNLDNIRSEIEISIVDEKAFEVSFLNGIAFVPCSDISKSKFSGIFEFVVRFTIVESASSSPLKVLNWPKLRLEQVLKIDVITAHFTFDDPKMILAVKSLGFEPHIIPPEKHPLATSWQWNNLKGSPCQSPYGSNKKPVDLKTPYSPLRRANGHRGTQNTSSVGAKKTLFP